MHRTVLAYGGGNELVNFQLIDKDKGTRDSRQIYISLCPLLDVHSVLVKQFHRIIGFLNYSCEANKINIKAIEELRPMKDN